MSDSVLTVLKICFLVVLYLFIARVVRAVWVEIFSERAERDERAERAERAAAAPRVTERAVPRPAAPGASGSPAAPAGAARTTTANRGETSHPRRRLRAGRRAGDQWDDGTDGREGRKGRRASAPGQLVIVEPPDQRGEAFQLADEITVGRGAGCGVYVDDTFASTLHARVFRREGQLYVEDLGSTNGTWINRKRVHGPVPIHKGDRLKVGNTVLEVRT